MMDNVHPTPEMKGFLWENVNFGGMTDEVTIAREMLAELENKE